MRKFFLFIFLILSFYLASSQDTIRLNHTNYISVFSKSKRYPVLVEWWITKAKIDCKNPLKRKDKFDSDPLLPNETNLVNDYLNSGFDRGHMMPAADNLCQTQLIQDECFYFSNISPQYHSLNAGDWKKLEMLSRENANKYDSVHVWCGNIGEQKKIGVVSVPKYCWKVVHIKKTNEWYYYIFENIDEKQTGIEDNKVTKETIQTKTGFKF